MNRESLVYVQCMYGQGSWEGQTKSFRLISGSLQEASVTVRPLCVYVLNHSLSSCG